MLEKLTRDKRSVIGRCSHASMRLVTTTTGILTKCSNASPGEATGQLARRRARFAGGVGGPAAHKRSAAQLEHRGLTRRELEILRMVATVQTNRETAQELFLSPRTVDMHVSSILTKLDGRSRTDAVRRGSELGLLTPRPG